MGVTWCGPRRPRTLSAEARPARLSKGRRERLYGGRGNDACFAPTKEHRYHFGCETHSPSIGNSGPPPEADVRLRCSPLRTAHRWRKPLKLTGDSWTTTTRSRARKVQAARGLMPTSATSMYQASTQTHLGWRSRSSPTRSETAAGGATESLVTFSGTSPTTGGRQQSI